MRIKAVLEYDGSLFKGFQSQKNSKNTIAGHLQNAFTSLKIESNISASGRTDKGVHATNQVIHLDIPEYWDDPTKLKIELNKKLKGIRIKKITHADDNFHARYSAKKRKYRYIFQTTKPNVFHERYISYYANINVDLLNDALKCFIGEYDFKNYAKKGSAPKNTIRKIYKAFAYKHKDLHIIIIEANGFLRAQVRMICADAIGYAQQKLDLKTIKEKLDNSQNPIRSKPVCANGLYLAKVFY